MPSVQFDNNTSEESLDIRLPVLPWQLVGRQRNSVAALRLAVTTFIARGRQDSNRDRNR